MHPGAKRPLSGVAHEFRGYGHEFEKAYTTKRVLVTMGSSNTSYSSDVTSFVRLETNGYIHTDGTDSHSLG
jgi:hypothetical protein